ncbi:MAG: hypothetical protein SPI36_02295 [Candidatus Onthovivens sp.]|nr:hypothetical protein [Candidatus Onthovivens sp.]
MSEEINYDYIDQSLLTVENVENILNTISPELYKLSYVTFDYPDVEEILNHKYSIINIKQFFNLKNNKNINVVVYTEETDNLNINVNDLRENENDLKDNSLDDDNVGHFILIINSSFKNDEEDLNNNSTCIVYPLYYINCFELENYLKNDCGFKNVVWNYNIIQHGNSSSCGWLCCKIAYDYFVKNKVEVECKEYELINY